MKIAHHIAAAVVGLVAITGTVQAQDWSGYYGGMSLGRGNGDVDYGGDGVDDADFEGSVTGLFVGYNMQSGSLVYGGELAYSNSNVTDVDNPTESYESFLDLKARLGFASGRGLYYGVLGYTEDTYFRDDGSATLDSTGSGVAFGIGADFLVSDKIFLGAEYLRRDLENDANIDYVPVHGVIDTLSIRVGMNF